MRRCESVQDAIMEEEEIGYENETLLLSAQRFRNTQGEKTGRS